MISAALNLAAKNQHGSAEPNMGHDSKHLFF